MISYGKRSRSQLSYVALILLLFNCDMASTTSGKVRSVFPGDFVKFTCEKTASASATRLMSSCSWAFLPGDSPNVNDTLAQVQPRDCFETPKTSIRTVNMSIYEGYLEVPEKADAIWCTDMGDMNNHRQPLSVQNVRLAPPISSFDSPTPQIVLRRFSDDYSIRFGAHDVTNQTVSINALETDRIKLLCIHKSEPSWENISLPLEKLMKDFIKIKEMHWVHRKLQNSSKWKTYLDFLREADLQSMSTEFYRQEIYIKPLVIRHMTNMSSRTYVCNSTGHLSYVTLDVEEPRNVGPDEIELIQQIITILESLKEGDSYTLISMLIVILLLFGYYCKKKLDLPPKAEKPPANPPAHEEDMNRLTLPTPAQAVAMRRKKSYMMDTTSASLPPKVSPEPDPDAPALLEVTTTEADAPKKESE